MPTDYREDWHDITGDLKGVGIQNNKIWLGNSWSSYDPGYEKSLQFPNAFYDDSQIVQAQIQQASESWLATLKLSLKQRPVAAKPGLTPPSNLEIGLEYSINSEYTKYNN